MQVTEDQLQQMAHIVRKMKWRYREANVDHHLIEAAAADGLMKAIASYDIKKCNGHSLRYWCMASMEKEVMSQVQRSGWWGTKRRGEKRESHFPVYLPEDYDKACIEQSIEWRQLARKIAEAMHALSPSQKGVIRKLAEGWTQAEISEEFGVSKQCVHLHKNEGTKRLQEALSEERFTL